MIISELYITCEIRFEGVSLCPESRSSFQCNTEQITQWNQWIQFPLKYRDLPFGSQLHLTVWDVYAPRQQVIVGQSIVDFFSESSG
jgi:phosphatidylinositol 3-kinase